jgi:hypothetical protein
MNKKAVVSSLLRLIDSRLPIKGTLVKSIEPSDIFDELVPTTNLYPVKVDNKLIYVPLVSPKAIQEPPINPDVALKILSKVSDPKQRQILKDYIIQNQQISQEQKKRTEEIQQGFLKQDITKKTIEKEKEQEQKKLEFEERLQTKKQKESKMILYKPQEVEKSEQPTKTEEIKEEKKISKMDNEEFSEYLKGLTTEEYGKFYKTFMKDKNRRFIIQEASVENPNITNEEIKQVVKQVEEQIKDNQEIKVDELKQIVQEKVKLTRKEIVKKAFEGRIKKTGLTMEENDKYKELIGNLKKAKNSKNLDELEKIYDSEDYKLLSKKNVKKMSEKDINLKSQVDKLVQNYKEEMELPRSIEKAQEERRKKTEEFKTRVSVKGLLNDMITEVEKREEENLDKTIKDMLQEIAKESLEEAINENIEDMSNEALNKLIYNIVDEFESEIVDEAIKKGEIGEKQKKELEKTIKKVDLPQLITKSVEKIKEEPQEKQQPEEFEKKFVNKKEKEDYEKMLKTEYNQLTDTLQLLGKNKLDISKLSFFELTNLKSAIHTANRMYQGSDKKKSDKEDSLNHIMKTYNSFLEKEEKQQPEEFEEPAQQNIKYLKPKVETKYKQVIQKK